MPPHPPADFQEEKMLEGFTRPANAIFETAAQRAIQSGRTPMDSLDVLAALSCDPSRIGGYCLQKFSISGEKLSTISRCKFDFPDISMTELQSQARREAALIGYNYAGGEHVLLALCMTKSWAASVIEEHGLHPIQLCECVFSVLGLSPAWDAWVRFRGLVAPDS